MAVEISIETTSVASELVADIISDFGSDVSIYDRNDFLNLVENKDNSVIWDYYDDELNNQSDIVICCGYFNEDKIDNIIKRMQERLNTLKENACFDIGTLKLSTRVDNKDWNEEWKKQYEPVIFDNFIVLQEFMKLDCINDKNFNKKVLLINPGSGFGTGQHESTKIALTYLDKLNVKDKRVLDVGCGSAILGTAALLMGAESCDFVDIDEMAIKNAMETLKLNNLDSKASFYISDKLPNNKKYDLILANITSDILISLKSQIKKAICDSGYLILSGLLKSNVNKSIREYIKEGFWLKDALNINEWCGAYFTLGDFSKYGN